ncbi:thiamine phosphate synthase [Pseudonocardia sp. TMWB2A]
MPLPRLWLMSDERMGAGFLDAVAALPPGSGVIFRHYTLPDAERKALFGAALRLCKGKRGCLLYLADSVLKSLSWQADGVHLSGKSARAVRDARWARRLGLGVSQSVHDASEMVRANRGGAVALVSPVYPTRSHPDGAVLGAQGFAALAQKARGPVIALGGMTPARFAALIEHGAYGWAAIDALMVKEETPEL